MTDKFDGKLWKWLIEHVLGKLVPSAADEVAGKVLKTDGEGGYAWSTDATGRDVPAGGTAGQVLTATGEDDGYGWAALPEVDEVPDASEASDGDVLTADGDGGYAWAAPAGGGAVWKKLVYNGSLIKGTTTAVFGNIANDIAGMTNPIVEMFIHGYGKSGGAIEGYGYKTDNFTLAINDGPESLAIPAQFTPLFVPATGDTPSDTYYKYGRLSIFRQDSGSLHAGDVALFIPNGNQGTTSPGDVFYLYYRVTDLG